jgi:hypothetical protein
MSIRCPKCEGLPIEHFSPAELKKALENNEELTLHCFNCSNSWPLSGKGIEDALSLSSRRAFC